MALPKAQDIVSTNPVVVFSKTYCPFCVEVKKLLSGLGADYKAIELDKEKDGGEVQAALAQWTGQRTVPNVFIGGNHIGGCDDTTALHNQGKLVPLLTQAGAVKANLCSLALVKGKTYGLRGFLAILNKMVLIVEHYRVVRPLISVRCPLKPYSFRISHTLSPYIFLLSAISDLQTQPLRHQPAQVETGGDS
ncbi:hypothetical protein SAY87_005201 [Trapa incisa]|uniref:Glutaredoxin domain-containing protein n=1 Tax=Trapa incisa TaxID=236973 RepID=A0AAN7Q6L1_9MYRT|nr:hypothetical protein SAY87_005201 [Trapa incisa]